MSNPLASIWEDEPKPEPKPKVQPKPKLKPKVDHTEAKAIFERYQERRAILDAHREYARKVAKATDGPGKTPVRPLATMGCNGGPLLCDHCLKPIVLETTPYYNVPADAAWASAPDNLKTTNWVSYIKGGLIVYIAENGTLRIYHGYTRPTDCDALDMNRIKRESDAFVADRSKATLIWKFLRDEFPHQTDAELNAALSDIMNTMFSYDPGLGINHP